MRHHTTQCVTPGCTQVAPGHSRSTHVTPGQPRSFPVTPGHYMQCQVLRVTGRLPHQPDTQCHMASHPRSHWASPGHTVFTLCPATTTSGHSRSRQVSTSNMRLHPLIRSHWVRTGHTGSTPNHVRTVASGHTRSTLVAPGHRCHTRSEPILIRTLQDTPGNTQGHAGHTRRNQDTLVTPRSHQVTVRVVVRHTSH
jgi:hypothetical protein